MTNRGGGRSCKALQGATRPALRDADLVTYAPRGVIEFGTGTAENYQDAWFYGYVPQLAACVRVGYPHAEVPLVDVEGLA